MLDAAMKQHEAFFPRIALALVHHAQDAEEVARCLHGVLRRSPDVKRENHREGGDCNIECTPCLDRTAAI
jgi:hypothetical protein